jgi:peptide/nickel transport system permease protein
MSVSPMSGGVDAAAGGGLVGNGGAVAGWRLRWRRFRRNRAAVASLGVLVLLVVFSLLASPLEAMLGIDAFKADLLSRFDPPSAEHWLGTDDIGRDVLVRLMYGGQVSLAVGLAATLVGAVIGTAVGLLAGYYGGRLDALLMRLTDGVIALPLLPLLIVFAAVDLTKLGFSAEAARSPSAGFWRIVVIIALVDWTAIARLVRAATLAVKEREFVLAAKGSGAGALHVMRTHILPNVATPIIVACTLTVGRVILFESVLSFLGFGIVPPMPSWGNMLNNAQELITVAPAQAIYPGLLIFVTVIAANFAGDGLQDAFDPKS